MEIKDLQPNQGNVDLILVITEKAEPRSFEKFGKAGRVCKATARDSSGEVKLTLWNDDIDKISLGDKIHLKNGWCSEYQGELQVSSGKFGVIEVLATETLGKEAVSPAETIPPSKSSSVPESADKSADEESTDEELVQEEETIE